MRRWEHLRVDDLLLLREARDSELRREECAVKWESASGANAVDVWASISRLSTIPCRLGMHVPAVRIDLIPSCPVISVFVYYDC